jgi:hypothetical protein
MSNNQGNPVRESQLGAGAVNTTGQSDDSSIGTPPASGGSTDATQNGATASSGNNLGDRPSGNNRGE